MNNPLERFNTMKPELSEEYKYALQLGVPIEIVNISSEIVEVLKQNETI